MNANSNAPTHKVTAAVLGAALATLIFALIPGAETVAVQGAGTTVGVFLCGYLVRD
jgi:uncharacterized membrane protein